MKNICVFTGTRAEYGLLRPLMERIREHGGLRLRLLVSGSHLSEAHGMTVGEIEADGFVPDRLVPLPLDDDTPAGVCRAMGEGLAGFGRALDELRPDMLVLLGDRWEALAAACAATVCRVPVAHLHGGELTRGAMDESFRHAITKMAHLHFTACEQYRRRVIQLGEAPGSVHNVGAIGLENIRSMAFLEREELSRDLGLDLSGPFVLATFHPTTLDPGSARAQAAEFFAALDAFPALPVVLTRAGADTEARAVNELAGDWASGRPGRARFVASLGQLRYLSAMRHCAVVAGNSSSGIIEAPSLGVPTVNVGERQDGRVRAASVIDCPPEREAITAALGRALSPDFAALARRAENPCEETGTAAAIVREVVAYAGNVKKTFHDLSSED